MIKILGYFSKRNESQNTLWKIIPADAYIVKMMILGTVLPQHCNPVIQMNRLPWEPKTFIFKGYNPYIGGVKPSFFMVLGSKGSY